MTGLGFPKDNKQFRDFARSGQIEQQQMMTQDGLYSDATFFCINK